MQICGFAHSHDVLQTECHTLRAARRSPCLMGLLAKTISGTCNLYELMPRSSVSFKSSCKQRKFIATRSGTSKRAVWHRYVQARRAAWQVESGDWSDPEKLVERSQQQVRDRGENLIWKQLQKRRLGGRCMHRSRRYLRSWQMCCNKRVHVALMLTTQSQRARISVGSQS